MALNNEGKALYRQGRFDEARAKYLAALQADPEFLAPRLNVACSFARQERFAEAAAEAATLVRRALVPWAREVAEAADLAALDTRPEKEVVRAALAEAAGSWGRPAMGALLFVARTRPALRLAGEGTLVLRLGQEVFAWMPSSGRYRQLTAEDGRVLAFVPSADGRRIFYVRGDKLVRTPGAPPSLRGLSIRSLDLATMSLGPVTPIPGDVLRLELTTVGPNAAMRVLAVDGARWFYFAGQALAPAPPRPAPIYKPLTPRGVTTVSSLDVEGAGCRLHVMDELAPPQPPRIRVRGRDGAIVIDAPFGAGLYGVPFP
jgi:hypothetical protein